MDHHYNCNGCNVTIVKLPKRLALKSNNGKFLKSVDDSYHSLDFASDDPNATKSGLEIQALPSGEIRVKSVYYKQFWKRANDGDQTVYAVAGEKETGNKDTLFWPVKISEKTIALRCVANGKYCSRNRMYYDYLHAAADTMVDEARFEVKELVSERKIYDVEYRVDEARIYDSEPLTAGSATLKNEGEKEALLSDKVVYEETATYAVTRSESVTAGLEFTFEGSLTKVVSFKLEMSREVSEKMEWEVSKSEKTTQEATVSALVPARSSVKISYAGSKGKYSVPFSYTQRDIDSTTGKPTITRAR
ncbi:uncharacterized protein LOC125206934 [Salvia hispanica]|uniref:uncharacterized protein LOC125206934 n=1 Tax=Salvia hispanica TaxID=49212 RepID=UPI0020095E80|nr:uncharacterized protein LOC125206934 [Salvia hispanica]